jgi:hypothetical protein
MDRRPLLAIDEAPVTLLFEGSPFLVAEKPRGMPVHPQGPEGRGTLANALFQSNRWLAGMETSHTPGVVHVLRPEDRGLVLVAKSDPAWDELRAAHAAGRISFRFRVELPADAALPEGGVRVAGQRTYGDRRVVDIDTTCGDTGELTQRWLGERVDPAAVAWTCYEIDTPVPGDGGRFRVALGERVPLPDLDVFAAPT